MMIKGKRVCIHYVSERCSNFHTLCMSLCFVLFDVSLKFFRRQIIMCHFFASFKMCMCDVESLKWFYVRSESNRKKLLNLVIYERGRLLKV